MTRAAFLLLVAAVSINRADVTIASGASRAALLRVCADPDNLPFSNRRAEGFENRIAELVATDMGARLEYTWWPQRRGFLRNTLNAGKCDVVLGFPTGMTVVAATQPYYRSSYVFVSRADRNLDVSSFDDARLGTVRVGVQLIGDDGANTPPAHALSRRGFIRNIVGFPVYDDPARIVAAVHSGDIDIAAVWGPLAGYYAARRDPPLRVVAAASHVVDPSVPLAFDISMAVRRSDTARRDALNTIIERRRTEIDRILAEYHVPRVPPMEAR
jgi:mxaJ protein